MKKLLKTRVANFISQCLYPVITSAFCAGRKPVDVLKSIMDGGVRLVQLREKGISDRELFNLAGQFRKITDNYRALLIIDDRLDVALATDADGVHLGQYDLPCSGARNLAPELLIGVSTHNPLEIEDAISSGASYVNIGPLFPTNTKELVTEPLGIPRMMEWSRGLQIPFTVMGGIKAGNIPELISAGARCFAMVTEITQADDITGKVRSLLQICKG